MNKLKNKLQNTKANFAKNFVLNLVVPAVLVVAALVVGIVFGFNKSIDFGGGVMVSVVADNNDLTVATEYNQFVGEVNEVLAENKVGGAVYLLEKDSTTYKDVLVVKIAYNGTEEQTKALADGLKSGLIEKFYAQTSESEIELRNLVVASEFGPSVDSYTVLASVLATLVTVLLICIYALLRSGLDTAVLALLSAVASNVLTFALLMLTRVPLTAPTVSLIPLVAIASALVTFMFAHKAKQNAKSDEYARKQNYVLANNTVKSGLYNTVFVAASAIVVAAAFALVNVCSPVLWFGLALVAGTIAVVYANLFVVPAIFALTFVRKVKKEKVKKEQKAEKQQKKKF